MDVPVTRSTGKNSVAISTAMAATTTSVPIVLLRAR